MQKWAGMLVETGKAFVDPSAMTTQKRGLRLLEFTTFNDLVLAKLLSSQSIQKIDLAWPKWTTLQPD